METLWSKRGPASKLAGCSFFDWLLCSTYNIRPARRLRGAHVLSRIREIDPLTDPRWSALLDRHSNASVFHSPAWLRCLRQTYGYEPTVFTSSGPGEPLGDGVVFCKVKNWFARPRLVSLPFSDHADPLVASDDNITDVLATIADGTTGGRWSSVELRPSRYINGPAEAVEFGDGQRFVLHTLDLDPNMDKLFRGMNKDSTRRKILKAQRHGMRYEEGRSERHLRDFFRLCVMTRRRKALPPPPYTWFRNLLICMEHGAKIRIVRTREGSLAGAIITLHFKDSVVFKYGASDPRYHNLGTVPYLLWQAIVEAKDVGAARFDFGRSEIENVGLIRFKDHFGARRSLLTHKVFPSSAWEPGADSWQLKMAKKVFAQLPDSALILAGRLIYPYIG